VRIDSGRGNAKAARANTAPLTPRLPQRRGIGRRPVNPRSAGRRELRRKRTLPWRRGNRRYPERLPSGRFSASVGIWERYRPAI